jgi:hypothetical protein
MAFLTLGGTDVEVQHTGASTAEPTYIGEAARAFDGTYRSGVRARKRSWPFSVIPLSQTDFEALEALVGLDVQLVATGDFNNGVAVTVVARLGTVTYIPSGTDFLRVATLTLYEV